MYVRLAHIRSHRHKRKLASLRKQAQQLTAGEIDSGLPTVNGLTDAIADCSVVEEMPD